MSYDARIHHRRSIRLQGYDYAQAGAYFVTMVMQNRECLFGHVAEDQMRLNAAGEMAAAVWAGLAERFPFAELDEFVIMPNHVHGIIVLTGDQPVGDERMGDHEDRPNEGIGGRGESCIRPVGIRAVMGGRTGDGRMGDHEDRPNEDIGGTGESCIRPVGIRAAMDGRMGDGRMGDHEDRPNYRPNDRANDRANDRPDRTGESRIRPGYDVTEQMGDHKDRPNDCPNDRPNDVGGTLPGTIGRIVQAYKSITTHEYILGVRQQGWAAFPGKLWQRNYYERIIRNERELDAIRRYIVANPLQWTLDSENPRHPPRSATR
jgi:REP element-mobilizing transposase RayT